MAKSASRARITRQFIDALCRDFEQFGEQAIQATRESDPDKYLAVVAKLVPQQIEVGEAGAFAELTDEELDAFIFEKLQERLLRSTNS